MKIMERNGAVMLLLPVKGIIPNKFHAVVFMAVGPNGLHVTSLVFMKVNSQYELGSVIAMIPSQSQVEFLGDSSFYF